MGFKGLPRINIRQMSWSKISFSPISQSSDDTLFNAEKQEYKDSPSEAAPASPTTSVFDHKPPKSQRTLCSRCLRLVIWSSIAAILLWAIGALFYGGKEFETHIHVLEQKDGEMEVVHWFTQPKKPVAAFFADKDLEEKWTVSIPKSSQFPLEPQAIMDICFQAHAIPMRLHQEEKHMGHPPYYHIDQDYMQVSKAIAQGILPQTYPARFHSVVQGNPDEKYNGDVDNVDSETGMCKRSLTFVMESADPGFGPSMMSLWLAYGMAVKEKRAFFIDDRNWAYGRWSTFFAPPPMPSCKPPPESHRVPCPHQADHLLVSTSTSTWTFGHAFEGEFEDAHKMEVKRQVNIFGLMRMGYEALFHLAADDAARVKSRIEELKSSVHPGISVGLHIRHGDKHPYLQEFSKTHIPSERYVVAANHELFKTFNTTDATENDDLHNNIAASRMILASDDAAIYNTWEEGDILRAQDIVVLTTPLTSGISGSSATLPLSFEGGFFANRFAEIKGSSGWFATDPGMTHRAMLGRSYLLDLAVIGSTDRIVCTVSSIGCRLLAVMMGWDRAILQNQWINVDGDWDWQGVRW